MPSTTSQPREPVEAGPTTPYDAAYADIAHLDPYHSMMRIVTATGRELSGYTWPLDPPSGGTSSVVVFEMPDRSDRIVYIAKASIVEAEIVDPPDEAMVESGRTPRPRAA